MDEQNIIVNAVNAVVPAYNLPLKLRQHYVKDVTLAGQFVSRGNIADNIVDNTTIVPSTLNHGDAGFYLKLEHAPEPDAVPVPAYMVDVKSQLRYRKPPENVVPEPDTIGRIVSSIGGPA